MLCRADELALLTGHDAQDMLSSLRASKHHIPALELDCPFEVGVPAGACGQDQCSVA